MRMFLHTSRDAAGAPAAAMGAGASGLQPRDLPRARLEEAAGRALERAGPARAVVDAALTAFDPQLDRIRPQAISAPVRRAGHVDFQVLINTGGSGDRRTEALRGGGHGALERGARGHRLTLCARPGADALVPGARGEIGIALGRGALHYRP